MIATRVPHTVEDLERTAFEYVGLDCEKHVAIDEKFVHPPEEHTLLGDPSKAMQRLGWEREVDFATMIQMMVDADVRRHGGYSRLR